MSPLKFLVVILIVVAGIAAVSLGGIFIYGREALWTQAFGPADLGPYDFDRAPRTGKPNDALACPPDHAICTDGGPSRTTPVFAVDAATLFATTAKRVGNLARSEIIVNDGERLELRAILRSRLLRFPDTLSIRVRPVDAGHAQIWIHSQSQIGHTDLGVNDRRVRRLIGSLRRALPYVGEDGNVVEPQPARRP